MDFQWEWIGNFGSLRERDCFVAWIQAQIANGMAEEIEAPADALVAAEQQSIALRGASSTERVALFLLDMDARLHGQIDLPMTRISIANHLGLTEETISRTFTALRRAKIIQYGFKERRIEISDKQRLKQLATDASDFDYWGTLKRRKSNDTLTAAPPALQ